MSAADGLRQFVYTSNLSLLLALSLSCSDKNLSVYSGECAKCPNAGLLFAARTFKDDPINSTAPCNQCTICGGVNQDGSQYELERCTEEKDTVCQNCELCGGGGVRIGCSGINPGRCVTIAEGVEKVLATQAISVPAILTEPAAVALGGDYPGVGVNMPQGTSISMPGRQSEDIEISVSVIVPSNKMAAAARSKGFELTSGVVYFGESGLQFEPSVEMNLLYDDTAIDQLATLQFRTAFVRWNAQEETWEEMANSEIVGSKLTVKNTGFSAYSAVAIPVDITLNPAAVKSPGTVVAGPPGAFNTPEEPAEEAPNTYPTIIAVSAVGLLALMVFSAFGLWFVKRRNKPVGLPSYLSIPVSAQRPSASIAGLVQAPPQSVLDARISGISYQEPIMPLPLSAAPQTQPSMNQLGALATPMSSTSIPAMHAPDPEGAAPGGVGAEMYQQRVATHPSIYAEREDDATLGRQGPLPTPMTSASGVSPMSTPGVSLISASLQSDSNKPSLTDGNADVAAPHIGPAVSVQSLVASSSKRIGLDPDAQSHRSARSRQSQSQSQRSDSPLGDLDYDSTINESSWGGSESSDGQSEGAALTQADLTALLAGVAAAENLGTMYLEPDSSNIFAGFDQFSAGQTPYTPASGDISPRSHRSATSGSRVQRARSNQGVPVSASAAIQVSSLFMYFRNQKNQAPHLTPSECVLKPLIINSQAIEDQQQLAEPAVSSPPAPGDVPVTARPASAPAPVSLPRLVVNESLSAHPLFNRRAAALSEDDSRQDMAASGAVAPSDSTLSGAAWARGIHNSYVMVGRVGGRK